METAAAGRTSRLTWLAVGMGTAMCVLFARVGADARWLAAMGREVARSGAIPAQIPYAAASSAHWTNVPVLAELIFHALESSIGDRGLVLAQLAAVLTALVLLAVDMRAARIPDAARALVLVAMLFAAAPALIVARSQLFSLALFPLLLLLVRAEARNPSRRIWLLPPLIGIWSNLHGAVLVGLFVCCAYLVLERWRRQRVIALSVLGASVGALFLTPALLQSGSYYLGVVHSEAAQRGEGMWAPLSPHSFFDIMFVVVAVPLVVLALRSQPSLWELVCIVALAVSAVHANRNTVWFAFFIAAHAARRLGQSRFAGFVPRPQIVAVCAVVPFMLVAIRLVQAPVQDGAGDALLRTTIALAHGRPILADELDAEWLVLDGQRVWIANPLDAFTRSEQRLYLDWLRGKPAGDRLRDRVTRTVLVVRGSAPQRRLSRDSAYRALASDRVAVLYVRNGSG